MARLIRYLSTPGGRTLLLAASGGLLFFGVVTLTRLIADADLRPSASADSSALTRTIVIGAAAIVLGTVLLQVRTRLTPPEPSTAGRWTDEFYKGILTLIVAVIVLWQAYEPRADANLFVTVVTLMLEAAGALVFIWWIADRRG